MDANSHSVSPELSLLGHMTNNLAIAQTGFSPSCALCHRLFISDNDAADFEAINICGDCKFLLLEDLGTPMRDYQRLYTSSRTTPSESRRWRGVHSDAEGDGVDSLFGETESNVTISGYRNFNSEIDSISYGGNSDASVDGNSYLDNDHSSHSDEGSDFETDTDTDIDPMHAGIYNWNSDNEWEEVDTDALHSVGARAQLPRSLHLNPGNWQGQFLSSEYLGTVHFRIPEGSQRLVTDHSHELEQFQQTDATDYLDTTTFEEHLAETDGLRRGAPPTAVSVLNDLPCLVVKEDHEQLDSLSCAICKDSLFVGTVVNRLPCSHLYHPSCIFPWLASRNSCPLCRYELPTDDLDYEHRKQRASNLVIHRNPQHEINEDGSPDSSDSENDEFGYSRTESGEVIQNEAVNQQSSSEGARGRWFLAAAAPVVGVLLMFWLGNPLMERSLSLPIFCSQGRRTKQPLPSQQVNNNGRRWWSLF
ncbi:uncharacterized protein LOC125870220 [Solanum stenotomum]|uniref:uncharacterized protein LOC125870220 n=1 Tax=Solanum stenotomum TaxID=172797 RepID=UPI0020D01DC8|nr:uncharacterized protein LOC125870220 [Solanum stenotomum]